MAEPRFAGQVVMITGAASGFGRLAARQFAEEGASLALSDVQEDALIALADDLATDGHDVFASPVDVRDEDQITAHIAEAEAQLGALTIAVNSAGIGHALGPLTTHDAAMFDHVMSVNARGVFLCMKHQLSSMKTHKRGCILNIASAAGLIGAGHLAIYAASKHAVVGLTRSAADEVARHQIRVNALCPSFAATPLFNDMADALADRSGLSRDEAYARISGRIPMRRVAQPEEVIPMIMAICDPANSFMTGQAIAVDGGLTAI